MNTKLLLSIMGLGLATAFAVACSDDSATTNNAQNPFTPAATNQDGGAASSSGAAASSSGTGTSSGSAACGKPAGCFCGTPTTQAEFLNRCTNSAALPVTDTSKPATLTDVP
jgi:hypothetical protein